MSDLSHALTCLYDGVSCVLEMSPIVLAIDYPVSLHVCNHMPSRLSFESTNAFAHQSIVHGLDHSL